MAGRDLQNVGHDICRRLGQMVLGTVVNCTTTTVQLCLRPSHLGHNPEGPRTSSVPFQSITRLRLRQGTQSAPLCSAHQHTCTPLALPDKTPAPPDLAASYRQVRQLPMRLLRLELGSLMPRLTRQVHAATSSATPNHESLRSGP